MRKICNNHKFNYSSPLNYIWEQRLSLCKTEEELLRTAAEMKYDAIMKVYDSNDFIQDGYDISDVIDDMVNELKDKMPKAWE